MSNHKTFEYTVSGDPQVRRTSSSRWAEKRDTSTDAPICDDETCPCHDEQPETVWVTTPDGTLRIPSQVNDEALNALSYERGLS